MRSGDVNGQKDSARNVRDTRDLRHWIVVADQSKAVIYARAKKRSPVKELFSMENSATRKKTASLITDHGGRSFDSHGDGRHTLQHEKQGPKQHLATVFAKDIVEKIVAAKETGECQDFVLIAAPRFLGRLRSALSIHANVQPILTIDKDIVEKDTKFIENLVSQ